MIYGVFLNEALLEDLGKLRPLTFQPQILNPEAHIPNLKNVIMGDKGLLR